jgi:hypothetical protein
MRLSTIPFPFFIASLGVAAPMPTTELITNSTETADIINAPRCGEVKFQHGPSHFMFLQSQKCMILDKWSYDKKHATPRPITSIEFYGKCACSIYV